MTPDLMMGLLLGFLVGAVVTGACVAHLWFKSERALMLESKVALDRVHAAWRRSNDEWGEMYKSAYGRRPPINVTATARKPRCGFCGSYAWPNCCERARS